MRTTKKYVQMKSDWLDFKSKLDSKFIETVFYGGMILSGLAGFFYYSQVNVLNIPISIMIYGYLGSVVIGFGVSYLLGLKRSGMLVK